MKKYEYGTLVNNGLFWNFDTVKGESKKLKEKMLEYCLNELGEQGWKFAYRNEEDNYYVLVKEIR